MWLAFQGKKISQKPLFLTMLLTFKFQAGDFSTIALDLP